MDIGLLAAEHGDNIVKDFGVHILNKGGIEAPQFVK